MGNKASNSATSRDEKAEKEPSYWQMAQEGYETTVKAIIRPPRSRYSPSHLGPRRFYFFDKEVERIDLTLVNNQGQNIACSHWRHVEPMAPQVPCVIYLHGNSSSRIESLGQLSTVLRMGCSFFAFDTAGSGLSDGEYVSLGFFEREDLATVIAHLREEGNTTTIALWGRSMGAATALLHAERDPSIAAMVLDSAFADLNLLAQEMVEKGRKQGIFAPGLVVSLVIRWIRQSVQKRANFDINDISPIKHADKCYVPALFIAGEQDDFISPEHAHKIHDKYSGRKNIILVEGAHNTPRPTFMHDSVSIFLHRELLIPDDWSPVKGAAEDKFMRGVAPWHVQSGAYRLKRAGSTTTTSSSSRSRSGRGGDQAAPQSTKQLSDETVAEAVQQLEALGMGAGGMTADRQAEIEQALNSMLGGRGPRLLNSDDEDEDEVSLREWTCPTCTLINAVPDGAALNCTACDHKVLRSETNPKK